MILSNPLSFEPLAMERVWGGRRLELLFGKIIPKNTMIGELWEIVDRPEAQSVVQQGTLKGQTFHFLWRNCRKEIFGASHLSNTSTRFPLMIKLLDASDRLSLQVHPPAHLLSDNDSLQKVKRESKNECWYIMHASQGSSLCAGFKKGITRPDFEIALQQGMLQQVLHCLPADTGESIFIPAGRIHALGAGLVVVEIQQNSDTTYRVFDWNRTGLDGKSRPLHVLESLQCINFDDFEPSLAPKNNLVIAQCPYFHVHKKDLSSPFNVGKEDDFAIITCLTGGVTCGNCTFYPGGSMLIPSCMKEPILTPLNQGTSILITRLPIPDEGLS